MKTTVQNRRGEAPDISSPSLRSPFEQLLYTTFQRQQRKTGAGMAVAVTAPHSGAGVSWVTAALVHELAKSDFNSVARISSGSMRKLGEQAKGVIRRSSSKSCGGLCDFNATDAAVSVADRDGPWEASSAYREECVNLLRAEFDYVLIDCPSLRNSGDVLSIAAFVDGILLVVEANRTRREQIVQAERAIEFANGKLLGHVLNKRQYQIPGWLFQRL